MVPMFESLLRWTGMDKATVEIPIEFTLSAMDEGGVAKGLLSAWWGPNGPLISNAYGPEGRAYLSNVARRPFFLIANKVVPELSTIFTVIPVCAFKLEPHVVRRILPAEDLKVGVDQT